MSTQRLPTINTGSPSLKAALYRLLEHEIVPAFYDRGADQVPHRWLRIVKEAIRSVAPQFSARRMVKEYVERMYAPATRQQLVR